MQKKDTKFDVAVIGGGPAGIMAAAQSARNRLRVILREKNQLPATKLLLAGGGRCNLTNAEFNLKKLVKNYHNGEFLFHAFSVFGPKETIEFFNKIGIETKAENNNRVFPKTNRAQDVLDALANHLAEKNVEMIFGREILDIKKSKNKITKIVLDNSEIVADRYILCTGGKSYPQTGSTGQGFELAKKLGHTIVEPTPALSPIILKEEWVKDLQAISLKDVCVSVLSDNKKYVCENGEIIFTHFGLSGPAILNVSAEIKKLLQQGKEVKISIDLAPQFNQEELLKEFEEYLRGYPKKSVKNILSEFAQERLAEVLLNIAGIDGNKIANNMSKIERCAIVKILKNFEVTAKDVMGFEQAMATRGGVSLKEINHKTMQSKIIDNLYFAGEIIDIDAKTGGFNLQMCWSTGYAAAMAK